MKFCRVCFVLIIICMLVVPASAEMRDKEFTKEETKKMAETKAVIETKFGNIELKFFPDVAPNHVDNFIQLARK